MHKNYYNIEIRYRDGLLLYNLLNKNFVYLEPDYREFYLNESNWEKDKIKLKEFMEADFILPDHIDERKGFLRNFSASRWNSRKLMFTIIPTTACNFCCNYCFEQGIKSISMDEETLRNTESFIKNKINEFKPEEVEVAYYGGEPLLEVEKILRIGATLNSFTKEKAISLKAEIVTNGYLYNLDTAQELYEKANVERAQITLDGPPPVHNSRRKHRFHGGTFYTIFQNMRQILESKLPIKINLRVNLDKTNISSLKDLLEILSVFASNENFDLYFAPVTGNVHMEKHLFTTEEYGNVYVDVILPLLKQYGFDYEQYPDISYVFCAGITPFHYLIDADGYIKKCYDLVGRNEHNVGDISTYDFNHVEVLKWELMEPLSEECKTCKFLPVCGGGCPFKKLSTGENHCEMWKYIMDKLLVKIYELKEENEKVYT
ncbi:MAG: hypothetical protein DRI22_01070 [Caldiserica bacterium]|nr:MAG: hypothetical protein DRI22_01070 [Caldisericota bacterium]